MRAAFPRRRFFIPDTLFFFIKPPTAKVYAWPSLDCCVSRGDMVADDGHVVHACHRGNVWTVDMLQLHACLLAHATSTSPPLQGLYNREWMDAVGGSLAYR